MRFTKKFKAGTVRFKMLIDILAYDISHSYSQQIKGAGSGGQKRHY